MNNIYVTGHKNPDLDSVSSAWCYARLKNIVDPQRHYVPVRIGHMNEVTKEQFSLLGVDPPMFIRDIRAKVSDVMVKDYWSLHPEDPVYELITLIRTRQSSVVPLIDDQGAFFGLLSLDEITSFFLREHSGERPKYQFNVSNFEKVLRGKFLRKGSVEKFEAFLMIGAMDYDVYRTRLRSLSPHLPLLVVGNRREHLSYAVRHQFPAIVITGLDHTQKPDVDFSSYEGHVFISYEDTAETIRLLRMSLSVRHLIAQAPPKVSVDDLFDDAKQILVNSDFRGLPVFSSDTFLGFVTRRCFLERPKRKVILVDHNELDQSVDGLEQGDVIEILDHHRLAAEKTRTPIFIASEPVGSTCTIVYHQFLRWSVPIDSTTARLLIAGIASDTVMLKSPTTTESDRVAIQQLCSIAHIADFHEFGEQLFSHALVLKKADPKQVIEADFKTYSERSIRFGIGQVEVITLSQVDEVKHTYLEQLEDMKRRRSLNWAMLLITDVIHEESVLLATSFPARERALIYPSDGEGKYILKGILSRKKQLLPEIVRVLEEGR